VTGAEDAGRSRDACPVCGVHALHLLYFPDVGIGGVRPMDELVGMGDLKPDQPPGIGCTACGSEWESLEDFRAAQRAEGGKH